MSIESLIWLLRVIAVFAILIVAAFLATPSGRIPLALRGIYRIMRRDRGIPDGSFAESKVSVRRRFIAFVLVLVAFVIAVI